MRLHWEDTGGSGPPVLLIMGLGMNATGWWRTIPVLAEFRVLAFDNRGVGRSERAPGPYTVAEMADDAVSVLDAAGVDAAHVYGISLGGMIAQEVALRHPDRVQALVLGATTAGGSELVPAGEAVNAFVRLRAQMTAEHAVWASVPINYARRTRLEGGDRIAEDIAQRLRFPVEPEYYSAQLAAAHGHDASVGDIAAADAGGPRRGGPADRPRERQTAGGAHPRRRAVDVARRGTPVLHRRAGGRPLRRGVASPPANVNFGWVGELGAGQCAGTGSFVQLNAAVHGELHVMALDGDFRASRSVVRTQLHVVPRAAAGTPAALPSRQLTFAGPNAPSTPGPSTPPSP